MDLHEAMAERVAKGELPGLVTLVAHGDDVRVDAIGTMAFGQDEPMRRDTVFRIASLTKPILATATMMLIEDGLLALDEPVDRLLPELADRDVLRAIDGPLDDTVPARRPITVEDLLSYRMGYGHIVEPTFEPAYPIVQAANDLNLVMGPPEPRTPHNPDEWIRLFGSLPLMYQPGERWQYNAPALVLSVLLARAAKTPLEDVFATRVFGPLGMSETGFAMPASQAHRLPSCYMTNPQTGRMEEQTSSPPSLWTRPPIFPSGAAGLISTVDDYFAFARLLSNRGVHEGTRLLSEESVALMTTNRITPDQIAGGGFILRGRGWGLGMSVATDTGRYGWEGGSGTVWCNYPDRDVIAVGLSQTSDFLFNGGMAEFIELAGNLTQ